MKGALTASAIALTALMGCHADSTESRISVRDSSGVRIVEDRRASSQTEVRIESKPFVVIGGAESDLYRISDAQWLADGRIAVATSNGEAAVYGLDGEIVEVIGSRGTGPGQFTHVGAIRQLPGGSLVLWDADLSRITELPPTRRPITHLLRDSSWHTMSRPRLAGVLSGGSFVFLVKFSTAELRGQQSGIRRDPACLHVCSESCRKVACVPGAEVFFRDWGGTWATTDVLFGADSYVATSGDRIYTADGAECEIDALLADGRKVLSIRRPTTRTHADRAAIDTRRQHAVAELPPSGSLPPHVRAVLERQARETPARTKLPSCTAMLTDQNGNVWVRRAQLPAHLTVTWDIFSDDGVLIASAVLPSDLVPTYIDSKRIVGLKKDSTGLETVAAHHVQWPDG